MEDSLPKPESAIKGNGNDYICRVGRAVWKASKWRGK